MPVGKPGTSRNAVVTLVSVLAVLGLAVFVPGLVPDALKPALTDPVVQLPAPGAGAAGEAPAVRTADGGTYRFSTTQPGRPRQPVTYRACDVIEVEVNLRGAPDPEDDLRMVLDGLERVNRATGLQLRYVGASERRPQWDRGRFEVSREELEDPDPVLVSFADAAEVPQLEGQVAGIAGSVVVGDGRDRRYLTGQVTLDTDTLRELGQRRGGTEVAAAITLHELGHLVGLDHVDDPGELMYAVTTDQRDFGPGDQEGLRRLGQGGCG